MESSEVDLDHRLRNHETCELRVQAGGCNYEPRHLEAATLVVAFRRRSMGRQRPESLLQCLRSLFCINRSLLCCSDSLL